jgi:hypothetical protein
VSNSNIRRAKQLGMPFGTACARLRKQILFQLIKRLKEDVCYRCGKKIKDVAELSIEHKKAWFNIDSKLFWDLNNIAFSHLRCNIPNNRSYGKVHAVASKENQFKPKLTEIEVFQIRDKLEKGLSIRKTAKMFNISAGAIKGIKWKQSWKYLLCP